MRSAPMRPETILMTVLSSVALVAITACDGSLSPQIRFQGNPFGSDSPSTQSSTPIGGGGGGGVGVPGAGGLGAFAGVDACSQSEADKFIRITLRNDIPNDFVHYFLIFVAFIDDGTGSGAVCADDIALYRANGYNIEVTAGDFLEFGNFCIEGPAMIRFHESGRFRNTSGTGLASAIAPAQGSISSFDTFFSSAGAQIPIPDEILWHNPGSGEGAALKVSVNDISPCGAVFTTFTPECEQDAFYYVTDDDIPSGGRTLGAGSFRRTPNEIQGTGCFAIGTNNPAQQLAFPGTPAEAAAENQFLRGGSITYVFIRDDQDPPIPQLVWEVRGPSGALVHSFDVRSGVN